jgi:hypothetical protein
MPPMLIRSSSRYRPKGIGCFFGEGLVKVGWGRNWNRGQEA